MKRLGIVLMAALLLRCVGITFGMPFLYHQDEPIIVNHALAMGVSGLNPHFFVIPSFTIYAVFLLSGFIYGAGRLSGVYDSTTDFAVSFLSDPSAVYLAGRVVLGVLAAMLTLYILWRAVRTHYGSRIALVSAVFLAVVPVHVRHSHYIYADIPVTLCTVLLCVLLWRWARTRGLIGFLGIGAVMGLGISVKYTMAYFAPAVAIVFAVTHGRRVFSPKIVSQAIAGVVVSAVVFIIFCPFSLLDAGEFVRQILHQAGAETALPIGHHLFYSIFSGVGWPVAVLAASGLVFGVIRKDILMGISLTMFIFFYLVNSLFGQPFERYMLPVIPLICYWAALGLCGLILDRIRSPRGRLVVLILVAAVTAAPAVYTDYLFLREDTRTQAYHWFEKNVASGTGVAVASRTYSPRLRQTEEQLLAKLDGFDDQAAAPAKRRRVQLAVLAQKGKPAYRTYWMNIENIPEERLFSSLKPAIAPDVEKLADEDIRYVIIQHSEMLQQWRDFLERAGESLKHVRTFSPYHDSARRQPRDRYGETAAPHLWKELFSRKSLGPYLEIYELKPADAAVRQ